MKKPSTRHRWGDRDECGPFKSETMCGRCGMVRASMKRVDDHGRQEFWKEFWRDGEMVGRNATPLCDARCEMVPA